MRQKSTQIQSQLPDCRTKAEGTADSAAADGLHSGTFYSKFFSAAYPHLHFGRNLEAGGNSGPCLLLGRLPSARPAIALWRLTDGLFFLNRRRVPLLCSRTWI